MLGEIRLGKVKTKLGQVRLGFNLNLKCKIGEVAIMLGEIKLGKVKTKLGQVRFELQM